MNTSNTPQPGQPAGQPRAAYILTAIGNVYEVQAVRDAVMVHTWYVHRPDEPADALRRPYTEGTDIFLSELEAQKALRDLLAEDMERLRQKYGLTLERIAELELGGRPS